MESLRRNGKEQHQRGQLIKRCLTFMLAVMVAFTSIPSNMAWADELPYSERPGSDEIILDDSVEEGDLSDIDLEISHTISKKGDKAVITVSAEPSETGLENGVTKVTKVEIHEDGRIKKGKRSDSKWEFTVKENGVYSFVIYYNSKDGEEIAVASPSEIEKVEPTAEAETQKPGGNAGGAGGTGTTQPEEDLDQEVTIPETEDSKTDEPAGDKNTEDESKDNESVEGDSNQNTPNEPEQKPSDNAGADEKGEQKGDAEGNEGGTDSSEQPGSGDGSIDGSGNTDNGSGGNSGTADNNGDTGSDNNHDSSSGDDSSSGSADNSNTDSSGNGDTGSSDSEGSGSSDSSGSESDDSGSSDTDSSDNGGSDSDESIALNVIDFFFPVIEAQASDFTVKKAVIVEYEITNLFPEGNQEDIDVDIFDELTEEGAMITLLAEPSEIGLEKGVREITDITLIDYEPEDKSEIIDGGEISTATDSEAEFNEEEESVKKASPSEAAYNTSKSSSAKHAEYQDSECDEGEYKFFVRENGTYTFAIRYGRVTDLDFEDSTELVETQFTTTYELESIAPGVQFIGVEDVTIQAGQEFDLLAGVSAVSDDSIELPVVIQDNGGLNTAVPGTYKITYTVVARSILEDGNAERSVTVLSEKGQALTVESDIHGTEAGKTLEISPAGGDNGILTVSYELPDGVKGRVLKFAWPEGTTATYPTQSIVDRYRETSIDGIQYECLVINDGASGTLSFQIQYQIAYGKYAFGTGMPDQAAREKIKEYLAADGRMKIGRIHVIADCVSDGEAVQPEEVSIGDFVTTKLEEGPIPQFFSSYRYWAPVSVKINAALQGDETETDYSVFSSWYPYFKDDAFTTEYKPWYIEKVRIYAPESFEFKLYGNGPYEEKGVVTGEDAEGYSYVDIPYELCSANKLRDLMMNLRLALREGIEVSRKTYTSKNSVLTYIDYGGGEKTVEINPVVSVELYPYTIEEVNQLGLQMITTEKEIIGGRSFIVYTYIENPVTLKVSGDGVKHYTMPNRTKDIKVSITYPDDLWVNQWNFSKSSSRVSGSTMDKGGTSRLEKLVIHMEDGTAVEYMVNKEAATGIWIGPGEVIPSGLHVNSVDFIFSELYGVETKINSYANTEEVNEKRTVETTAAIDVDGAAIATDVSSVVLIPRPMLQPKLSIDTRASYSGKNDQYLSGRILLGLGLGRKGTNCKIRIDDGDALQFLDGTVRFPDGFQGGKIYYETSLGRTGESEIPQYKSNEIIRFTTLEPEEKLTVVEIHKDGVINGGSYIYYDFRKVTYEELKKFALDGETAQFGISGSVIMDESKTPVKSSASEKCYIYYHTRLGNASLDHTNEPTVYQGEKLGIKGKITIPHTPQGIPNLGRMNFTAALDYTIYCKLANTDKFLFMGLGSDEFDAVVVTEENEKYIKITPKEVKEFYGSSNSSSGKIVPDPFTLIFQVIPGAETGRQVVIDDIYFIVDQTQREILDEDYRVKVNCDSAMDAADVPGWVTDKGLFMWDLNTKVETEILQQNIESVNIIPGLGAVYQDSRVVFHPTGREDLNAMVSIGSGSDTLTQYKVRIPLPRKDKEISYNFNGDSHLAVSEYNLYLRDEITYINNGIPSQIRYKLAGGDSFLESGEVNGRWSEVEEIEIFIETMPAKSTVVCYMDLEAEGKETIGIGEKNAYLAAWSQSGNGTVKYGNKADYIYQDVSISGKAWIDNNENGKYESGEPYANNLNITLLQDGMEVDESNYFISMDPSKGNYTLNTCLNENLSMRFDGLDGNTDGVKPTLTKANTNGSISVFDREGEWKVELPEAIKGEQSGYDLGIVKLPVLTANNTKVGYKSEVQADVSVQNQKNAPAVNNQIIYGASEDTSTATVSYTGLIKGLKENGLTTATASVINSLGDKVSATYQIAVSDNKEPILTVHPWVAIEGDSIPDLWYGVTVEEPEEEYPAWQTFLFGANKLSRSIPKDNKDVKIYTNGDYTGEISLEDALKAHGLYYMRYFVEDDKENVVAADTTLTVYGKMQGVDTTKHYFETGETVSVPNAEFFYLDISGARVPVTEGIHTAGANSWILNKGSLGTLNQTAVHPQAMHVSDGVSGGEGSEATATISALVDSKVHIGPMLPELIAIQDEFWGKEEMGWNRLDGVYQHGNGISNTTWETRRAERTAGVDGVVAPGTEITIDTSVPNVFEVFRSVTANEEYDNIDSNGQPLKNAILQTCKVYVVSKPVVEATDKICVTPDQALDESFIKGKITATATYYDGTNPTAVIPDEQFKYVYNKQPDGEITSVTITAWGGRVDNISSPAQVEVIIRKTPILTLPDIHLRKGTEYGPENFLDRVLIPADEHNEYSYIMNDLDTNTLGKYEAQYQVSDKLTGAETDQSQIIYVHGSPEITATDQSLYVHQSTGGQALIDAVKKSVRATVEYTKADGITEIKIIPANELHYEVSPDYVAGTAGRFKVAITADDATYAPAGLEPMRVTKDVFVDVADQLFDVTFTTNSDNFHDRGTVDGEAGPVVKPTIYGKTVVAATPAAKDGYHFDGFKTLNQVKATQTLTLKDGTVIAAGDEIPVGTMLSIEQVQAIEIFGNVGFQAYFSASPVLNGRDIKLYVGETYRQADLEITVSDLDGDAQEVTIRDSHVDTGKAGTYQIKVSVDDGDQNHAELYVYVQVYGKTELEGYDPIHIRKGQDLSEGQLKDTVKAVYLAPPAVPDSPWGEEGQPAVRTEIPFVMEGTVNTQEISLTKLTISAEGQIEGREADGQDSGVRNVFVHGNPIITGNDGALYTHQSTDETVLIDVIKQSTAALVQYVEPDGSIRTETLSADNLNYEIKAEESYQPRTEGTYKVTISFNDTEYVPNGLQPIDTELSATVTVSDKAYSVKFTVNNDEDHHKGDYEGGISEFNTNAIHGNPAARIPVPVEVTGYHFDGFKTCTVFTTTDDIRLADGSTISAGTQIPAGTILTPDQVREIKIYEDVEFQAYFSASPMIKGQNIVLYEKEAYSQDKLHIEVSDLDQNAEQPLIDDLSVNTDVAGTYQIKVTVHDGDGNLTEKYLYVQVVGKTRFTEIPDLHIRKDSTLTKEQLLESVKAVYDKPEDIPGEPWTAANKVNNGRAAITTAVEVRSFDEVSTGIVQKTQIDLSASGMIHGREMTGKADAERNIYIHGNPVVVVYDNGVDTHKATDSTVLEQVVHTGNGNLKQDAANAYVEYVQPDGSIQKVVINPDKITYTVNQFVPLTEGEYLVYAKVDDSSVLTFAQAPDLTFAEGEKEAKVVVVDKMYTVNFEIGENGSFENPADSMTVVTHGSKVAAPAVVLKEGYIFSGWLDEEGNRVASVSDIVITSDCTFTAEIKLKEFTVRFIGKNGNVISTQIVKYGADANPPTDHADVKDGRFVGWDESYTNITKDMDIHAKYRSNSGGSGSGGPSGGDRYVPSGPGNTTTTITENDVPKNPFENLVTIGTNPVPAGNMEIPAYTGLPKTGDVSVGIKTSVGYQATLIEGTRILSEDEPLVGQPSGSLLHVFEGPADWKKCILHIILLIISALEGIFYIFKRKKDKRVLDKLRKELGKEDK